MADDRARRKLLQEAIARVGADTLPGQALGTSYKHEGNRLVFSELRRAEEDYLLQAQVRRGRFGNVTAGGPEAIAESAMRRDEAAMRAAAAEITGDPAEAEQVIDAFIGHVRVTFGLVDSPGWDGRRP